MKSLKIITSFRFLWHQISLAGNFNSVAAAVFFHIKTCFVFMCVSFRFAGWLDLGLIKKPEAACFSRSIKPTAPWYSGECFISETIFSSLWVFAFLYSFTWLHLLALIFVAFVKKPKEMHFIQALAQCFPRIPLPKMLSIYQKNESLLIFL